MGSDQHFTPFAPIPPSDAERFHRDIALSRLIVFDRPGQVPQEEDPAATVAVAKQLPS